ncbi:DUF2336 domain-containing protein [Bradyrhizobium sp. ARR65]|uniref:DUF2336 domain-containing protein n=1 Tax=Bradyrhizobium sp. ARR65 TaxID=1040989 RepID=UPI000463F99E|nr:DUF2336 domain-containing protein [Bradyrhizobium sp. ARR65]
MTMFYSLIRDVQDATTSGSTKRQLKALTRITDLFLAGSARYSKRQIELFDDVFKVLVEVIELRTRIKLARRFATDSNAPSALVRAFALDESVAVAAPVLTESNALSESDLIASASTQSQGHLYAIAQRETISEAITDVLIERGEPKVVHAVARNEGARISDNGFRALVVRSGHDQQLAAHVGARRDIPRHHLLKLLETASASVCSKIIAANPKLADVVHGAVTEVIDDINVEVRRKSQDHVKAKHRVKRLTDWKELREADVHAAARAQDFEKTVTMLSALAGCHIEMVERAVLNENPGAIQVIAKAAGCSWATAKALLLMTVAERRLSKLDIERARENFERLEQRTAQRVLEFYEARRNLFTEANPPLAAQEAASLQAMLR